MKKSNYMRLFFEKASTMKTLMLESIKYGSVIGKLVTAAGVKNIERPERK